MRIVVLSLNEEDGKFFKQAASTAGFGFETASSPSQVCDAIQKDQSTIVVIDVSTESQHRAFEKAVAEKIGLFSGILNPNCFFFIGSSPFHECQYLLESDIFGHFIQRPLSADSVSLIGNLLKMTASDRAFGLENYFQGQVKCETVQIINSLQKKTVVESFNGELVKNGFKPRIATAIALAADELIMNAIFDAPVDELGRPIHAQTPRNAAFDLSEREIIEFKTIFDGDRLGISVMDKHGSLNKKKLLSQHIGKSYESAQYETRIMTAGAGLGLSHVYRNSGGLVFASEAGARTEVCIFFKKAASFRDFKDQFRFLSVFMYF